MAVLPNRPEGLMITEAGNTASGEPGGQMFTLPSLGDTSIQERTYAASSAVHFYCFSSVSRIFRFLVLLLF